MAQNNYPQRSRRLASARSARCEPGFARLRASTPRPRAPTRQAPAAPNQNLGPRALPTGLRLPTVGPRDSAKHRGTH
eukprot:1694798-Alexandrium_andersonii.AAC.1